MYFQYIILFTDSSNLLIRIEMAHIHQVNLRLEFYIISFKVVQTFSIKDWIEKNLDVVVRMVFVATIQLCCYILIVGIDNMKMNGCVCVLIK